MKYEYASLASIVCVLSWVFWYDERRVRAALDRIDLSSVSTQNASLSAFYPCSRGVRVTEEVLRRFRRFYPSAQVFMWNDGGADESGLRDLAVRYGADYERTARVGTRGSTLYEAPAAYFRWVAGFVRYDTEFSLLLEDDVWLMRPLPLHEFRADINHVSVESRLRDGRVFGGCGGAVFRVSTMRAILRDYDAEFVRRESEWLGYITTDRVTSAYVYKLNGTIAPNPCYYHCYYHLSPWWWRDVDGIARACVVHKVKFLY